MKTLTTKECRGYIAITDGETVLIKVDNDKAELAALIVRAVNMHEELIGFIRVVKDYDYSNLSRDGIRYLTGVGERLVKRATE